jgi:hypothetical protein
MICTIPLVEDPDSFYSELYRFMNMTECGSPIIVVDPREYGWKNSIFQTASIMVVTYLDRKNKQYSYMAEDIIHDDWRIACHDWLKRREK